MAYKESEYFLDMKNYYVYSFMQPFHKLYYLHQFYLPQAV